MIAQTRLAQIFAETAVECMQAFPQETRGLYVAEVISDPKGSYKQGIAFVSPAATEVLEANPDKAQKIIQDAHEDVHNEHLFGSAVTENVYDSAIRTNRAFNLVSIRANFPPTERPFTAMPMPIEMDVTGIIDHEFGHLLMPLPQGTAHARECAATAYTAICHAQRYGWRTNFFAHAPFTHARALAHGRSENHYTAAVLQKVASLEDTLDVQALDKQQTVALAARIGRDYALTSETLERLSAAFKPLADWLETGTTDFSATLRVRPETHPNYFEKLFNVVSMHQYDHDIFRLGNLIVEKHRKELKADFRWEEALDNMRDQQRRRKIEPNLAKAIDAGRGQPFLHIIKRS